jgi:hypothetical protein
MKRSVSVTSHHEGDAIVRVLESSGLRAVNVITGLLLSIEDPEQRARTMQIVQQQLQLAADEERDADANTIAREHSELLAMAGSTGE